MTLAKGLGGGVPVAAILAKESCAVFTPGDHGSTYGGNPLMTAAALAVTQYMIDNDMQSQVEKSSAYLVSKLEALKAKQPAITHIRGKGLLLAVGFANEIAEKVTLDCLANGLIGNNVRPNAFRLAPPLTVSNAEIDEAVAIIEKAVAAAA
jgi:acetylornithine/succinyldiaminopimelate/putrescine aminotransferase